ncbi:MAG TPA: hypothetical protein PKU70_01830 [Vicinamibacteria bacterium]|nr:hypothetical protein [Vicinamibacteria bacterium]HRB11723.1 hypothetical protein [Vicinamibacteria bacterium]
MSKVIGALEIAANIAIVLIAALLVGLSLGWIGPARAPGQPAWVQVGDQILIDGADWKDQLPQVVVVFGSQCHFCREGGDFYSKLLGLADQHVIGLTFVANRGDAHATRSALKEMGLGVALVAEADFGKNRFYGTPILLLTDATKKVRQVWRGRLAADAEAAALAAITGRVARRPIRQ